MEPEIPLPRSQEFATSPYPQPHASKSQFPALFLYDTF